MTNDFLDQLILSNTVRDWLLTIGFILFILIFSKGISKLLAILSVRYFTTVAHKHFKETIEFRVARPLSRFLFWLVTYEALQRLNFPEEFKFMVFKTPVNIVLNRLNVGVLTILFFNILIGIMHLIATVFQSSASRKNDRSMLQLVGLLSDLIRAALIILCILFVLKAAFNISLSSFVTSVGLVTAALALAAKDTVENIICSVIILLDKPFFLGDYISVGGASGTVEKIGLRRTILRTDNKTLSSVPNRDLTGNKLENISNQTFRRFTQNMHIATGATNGQIAEFVTSIRALLEGKLNNPLTSYNVFFKETGTQANIIYMEYFVSISLVYADFCALNQEINLAIVGEVQDHGLEMAPFVAQK